MGGTGLNVQNFTMGNHDDGDHSQISDPRYQDLPAAWKMMIDNGHDQQTRASASRRFNGYLAEGDVAWYHY